MIEKLAIGMALAVILIFLRGKRFQVNGLLSILLFLVLSYGLGNIVMLLIGRIKC